VRMRRLPTWVLIVAVLAAVGCKSKSEMDDLLAQSPFKTQPRLTPGGLVLVSLEYHPLQLPGGVDVTAWSAWTELEASLAAGPAAPAAGVLNPQQVQLWRENGFYVVWAPRTAWPRLREQIVQAGGTAREQTTVYFRNSAEVARLPALWNDRAASCGVADGRGSLRVHTLEPSQAVFSLTCQPPPADPQSQTAPIRFKIVPELYRPQRQERLELDETGKAQRWVEELKVSFESLALSVALRPDEFLMIAARPERTTAPTLGNLFLSRSQTAENYQWVAVLTPAVITARQVTDKVP